MPTADEDMDEDILKARYLNISKIVVVLAVIYSLWIVVLILGVYFLGFGNKWVFLTMDQWVISSIIIFAVFIGLEILFIFHHYLVKRKRIEGEKPKPLNFKGRKLHVFTVPKNAKGGIFSKTYIKIDEENILNLRFQMIPPNELWRKEEN